MASNRDVPEECPGIALGLDQVGITNKTVWLRLTDGRIPFTAAIHVTLAADRRGIHMSRMEESITALAERQFADPGDYAGALLADVVARQHAEGGTLALSGKLPLSRVAPVSHRLSNDSLEVRLECEIAGQHQRMSRTVRAHHITACPCTQRYTGDALAVDRMALPLPTHSQRCVTTLTVEGCPPALGFGELHDCLCQALHRTQDLLKRSDEAELVLAAHRRPQFAEDAVRETALVVARRLGGRLLPESRVTIDSVSLESIHVHDVHCRLSLGGERLRQLCLEHDDDG